MLLLSPKDAHLLASKRHLLPKRIEVTVNGTVKAVSEKFISKKSQLFLIDVEGEIVILVKDCHQNWHKWVSPMKSYVFHNLQLTVIEKGSNTAHTVFVATKGSFCENREEYQLPTSPLHVFLRAHSITLPVNSDDEDDLLSQQDNLVSYEGVVTSEGVDNNGHIVLDGCKLMLNPMFNNVNRDEISLNCKITVYNAHLVKDQGHILVSCARTLIKANASGSMANPQVPEEDPSERAQEILEYSLGYNDMKIVAQLKRILQAQGKSRKDIHRIVTRFLKSAACSYLEKSPHTVLDQFIHHDRLCPLSILKISKTVLPLVHNLSDVINSINSKVEDNRRETSPTVKPSFEYQHVVHENGILVGQLITSSGHLFFLSGNEKIPALILAQSTLSKEAEPLCEDTDLITDQQQSNVLEKINSCDEDTNAQVGTSRKRLLCSEDDELEEIMTPKKHHICTPLCLSFFCEGQKLECPILEPQLIGRVLAVKKHHAVSSCENNTLIAFSLLDCILLEKISQKTQYTFENRSDDLSSHIKSQDAMSRASESSLKRPGSSLERQRKPLCAIYVQQKFPASFECIDFGRIRRYFKVIGIFVALKELDVPKNLWFETAESTLHLERKQVSLKFKEDQIRWHSIITPGEMYIFEGLSQSTTLSPVFANSLLETASSSFNFMMEVDVPEDVSLRRLVLPSSDVYRMLRNNDGSMMRIGEVLDQNCSLSSVSICCIIQSQEIVKSQWETTGKSFAESNQKLKVIDTSEHKAGMSVGILDIYLDAAKTKEVLGLIPGAVVEFFCLERKVSKIGNTYCRFTDASTAHVVDFSDINIMNNVSIIPVPSFTNLKRKLLHNIWTGTVTDLVCSIECWVCHVFKLSVKVVCTQCGGIYYNRQCQSRGCHSTRAPKEVANASILVEDGSGQASVQMWGSNLVRQLLSLSIKQWEDLLDAVSDIGEIFIDREPTSPVSQFVHQLLTSRLVKRPCRLAVKLWRNSKTSSVLDAITVQELKETLTKIGPTSVNLFCLPFLQLDCLNFKELD